MAVGLKVEYGAIAPGALAMIRSMLERGFLGLGQ
jgi:hypothetical protein